MSLKILQEKIGAEPDGILGKDTLKKAMVYYKLTPIRTAHFFAQTSHETGEFKTFYENLNYSAKRLQEVFGKYFPGNLEESYANKPEKIANRVYADRMGNGNEASGDGWKYRGRGAIQLSGKYNYKLFSEYINKKEILINPDLVAEEYSFETAMFYFNKNKLWLICDKGINDSTILELTKRINGGINGLEDRKSKTYKYYSLIK